jgi:CRP-like cAMP-binding protein
MSKKTAVMPDARSEDFDSSLVRIANVAPTVRHVVAGAALFRQGDPTFGIFRLVSGRINLIRITPAGTQVPMHTARPGELFAEASIFSARYHCDAVAIRDCVVWVYPKAALMRQLREGKDDLWAFAAELAHRVQGLRTRLELRQIRAAPERVLQSLRLRCDSSGTWKVEGTLKQFAEEIGLTHEALYRALATLKRSRLIVRVDNEIRLASQTTARGPKSLP